MNEEQLATELDRMGNDATGNNSKFMGINSELLDRYEGNPYGDEAPERSKVISNDVMDVVEADMPSLARVFLGSNDVLVFKPNNSKNQEDKAEAEQKTKYVKWQIFDQPWSFPVLHGFIKNAEIQKLSVCKYFIEERTEVEEHRKTGLSNDELAAYQSEMEGESVESVEIVREENDGEEENAVVFKVERTKKQVKLSNIKLENFRMTRGAESVDDADLVGDDAIVSRGDLLAAGYEKNVISDLPLAFETEDSSGLSRVREEDQGGDNDNASPQSWASEEVLVEYRYVKIDFDDDGIAERRYIVKSGSYILTNEVFNHVPYAVQSAILMPHEAVGKSRAEITAPTAFAKTHILRGIQDNIYAVNAPRMAYNEEVEEDDLLVIRPNGGIRTNGDTPPGNHLMPITVPYIGDKGMQVLQYWDQSRAQTTGSLLASQGLDADKLGKETATRFEGVNDASKSKVELVARVLAETGFRKLYEGVAWLNTNFQDSPTEIEVLGEELKVDPREWKYNHQLNSKVGLGAGDKRHLSETLSAIWAVSLQLRESGSVITDEKKQFNILRDLAKSAGVGDETEYFNNPEKPDELLKAQNEQLMMMVQQMQQQLDAMQNPLAEAEQIKQQAFLLKAQSDAQIQVAKLEENQRQFNIETAQKQDQFMKDLAAKLAELDLKFNAQLPEPNDINGS